MMTTTYDFRPESLARWVKLADEHLRSANMLADSAPWHAAFWYHQAAERSARDVCERLREFALNDCSEGGKNNEPS